jgi:hypothetical protein
MPDIRELFTAQEWALPALIVVPLIIIIALASVWALVLERAAYVKTLERDDVDYHDNAGACHGDGCRSSDDAHVGRVT